MYLRLSAGGPLGVLGSLCTPTAMIIAQTVLVTPLVVAVGTGQAIANAAKGDGDVLFVHA